MSRKQETSKKKQEAETKKSPVPLFIIFGVLVAAVVAGALLIGSNRSGGTRPSNATAQPPANRAASFRPGAQPPQSKGQPDAPVTIEEFGDYQCPPCGFLHPVVTKLEAEYRGRVHFIFRHLPLQRIHPNAALAARAAEAAGLQNNFWGMHDLLYANQKEWSDLPDPRPRFNDYAQRLGLNAEKFRTDMDRPEVSARIVADVQRADSIGLTGTPSVFINGLPVESLREEDMRREIEAALSRKGQ